MATNARSRLGRRPFEGLPTAVAIRLRPSHAQDQHAVASVVLRGHSVVCSPSTSSPDTRHGEQHPQRVFEFDSSTPFYDRSSSNEHIFQNEVRKLISTVDQGFNVSVLALGATGSGKTFSFVGDVPKDTSRSFVRHSTSHTPTHQRGLIPLAVEELFQLLSSHRGEANVFIQYVEVYADTLHDLLDRSNRHLKVEHADHEGPRVSGATYRRLRDSRDFEEAFFEAQNRTRSMSDFGAMSDRASTFLTLSIELDASSSRQERLSSRLTFVELPGTEKLCEIAVELRRCEGPTLNKECLAVGALMSSLAAAHGSQLHRDNEEGRVTHIEDFSCARYWDSKTTSLLSDVLGGNSLTLCLAFVDPMRALTSEVTLRYAQLVARIRCFPLVNDDRACGLLSKLHCTINDLHQQALCGGEAHVKDDRDLEFAKANELQLKEKLLNSETERLKVFEGKEALQRTLAECRAKHEALVEQKIDLQNELIKSEEERLRLSELLLDVQIEIAKEKEDAQEAKFEVESRLISAEADAAEVQKKEKIMAEEIAKLKHVIDELKRDHRDLEMEYAAMRQNFQRVGGELSSERAKNGDIGVELLNLVNENRALTENIASLKRSSSAMVPQSTHQTLELELVCAKAVATEAVANYEKEQAHHGKVQAELQSTKLQNHERQLLSISTSHEDALQRVKVELKRAQSEAVEMKAALEKAHAASSDRRHTKKRGSQVLLDDIAQYEKDHQRDKDVIRELEVKCDRLGKKMSQQLEDSESEAKKLRRKLADAEDEVESLERKLKKARRESTTVVKRSSSSSGESAAEVRALVDKNAQLEQIMQRTREDARTEVEEQRRKCTDLEGELEGLRSQLTRQTSTGSESGGKGGAATEKLKKEKEKLAAKLKESESQMKELEAELQRLKEEAPVSPKTRSAATSEDTGGSTGTKSGDWEVVKKLEKERAKLLSRASAAETELATVKKLTQKRISDQVAQISKLKKAVAHWKKKAGG